MGISKEDTHRDTLTLEEWRRRNNDQPEQKTQVRQRRYGSPNA